MAPPSSKGRRNLRMGPLQRRYHLGVGGKIRFENLIENVTYRVDATTSRPILRTVSSSSRKTAHTRARGSDSRQNGQILKTYALPVGAHVMELKEGDDIKVGDVLVKIPRSAGNAGDITGGLPRVTELFEARNPSNPAIVSEIDGEVKFGKLKRGNREISVTSKLGETKEIPRASVKTDSCAGERLRACRHTSVRRRHNSRRHPSTSWARQPYRSTSSMRCRMYTACRGVKINDKHFEVIVRQMMRKVNILDPGDTCFLEQQVVDKREFMEENDRIWGKKVKSTQATATACSRVRLLPHANSATRTRHSNAATSR